MLDSTTDTAIKNQCSIVLRCVTRGLVVSTRVIEFKPSKSCKAVGYVTLITKCVDELQLNVLNCVACCIDGASNLISDNCGVSGLLRKLNSNCIFIWCTCHRLNLIVQDVIGKNSMAVKWWKHINNFGTFCRRSSIRMSHWRKIVQILQHHMEMLSRSRQPDAKKTTAPLAGKPISKIITSYCCYYYYYCCLNVVLS